MRIKDNNIQTSHALWDIHTYNNKYNKYGLTEWPMWMLCATKKSLFFARKKNWLTFLCRAWGCEIYSDRPDTPRGKAPRCCLSPRTCSSRPSLPAPRSTRKQTQRTRVAWRAGPELPARKYLIQFTFFINLGKSGLLCARPLLNSSEVLKIHMKNKKNDPLPFL